MEAVFDLARSIAQSIDDSLQAAYRGEVHESLVKLMTRPLQREWPYEKFKNGAATVVAKASGDYAIVVNV